jgi:hypothetical protein
MHRSVSAGPWPKSLRASEKLFVARSCCSVAQVRQLDLWRCLLAAVLPAEYALTRPEQIDRDTAQSSRAAAVLRL